MFGVDQFRSLKVRFPMQRSTFEARPKGRGASVLIEIGDIQPLIYKVFVLKTRDGAVKGWGGTFAVNLTTPLARAS